jgi:hypothetical protein
VRSPGWRSAIISLARYPHPRRRVLAHTPARYRGFALKFIDTLKKAVDSGDVLPQFPPSRVIIGPVPIR